MTWYENHGPRTVLCLGCASLHQDDDGDPIVCPHCGRAVDRTRYERIARYAGEAARYGHLYRRLYESRGTARKSCLKPDGVLTFVAIAALSGVIGSAAYDLVKAMARKIVESCRASGQEVRGTPEGAEQLEILIAHIRSYHKGMPDAAKEIRDECLKEKWVDEYARAGGRLIFDAIEGDAEFPSIDEIKSVLRQAQEDMGDREPPDARDFEGAWLEVRVPKRD